MENLATEERYCCRLCATPTADVVNIYNDVKTGNEIADRINMHLPVSVAINDTLPLFCCTRCANTLTDYHELVLRCLEADSQLKEMRFREATYHNDSLDDHSYVDIEFHSPSNGNGEDSLLNNDENKLFTPGSTLTVVQTRFADNLSLLAKDSYKSVPDETVLQVKLLPVQEKGELVLRDGWVKPSNSNPPEIGNSILNMKSEESVKAEDCVEDTTAVMQYPCELCNVSCQSEEEFVNHVQEVHKDQYEVLQIWPVRDKATKKRGPVLPERTKRDKMALVDAKILVNDKVYYQCQECGKNLCSSYTFLWHMRIHTGERPHVCDLCGKQFRVAQGLIRHLRETHEGIKNFQCDICNRMFSSKRNVEEHRNIHTNERPYICDTCGKRFKQKASLFVHNRSHTDVFPFPCTYCAQTYRTSSALLVHVRRHTGEKPFTCDVCGRAFRVKYELSRHRLIHSDEKPFECVLCHLTFRQKRYLRNHKKITHGIVEMKADDDSDYICVSDQLN